MSYTYFQGQGEESSEVYSWDTDPCALLKSSRIVERFCSSDNETEYCQNSQFGTMCELSTENHGEEKSMSCAEDSPVKTFLPLVKVLALRAREAGCGRSLRELFMKYDRATSSWKTHQCLWEEVLPWSSVILPRWGTMQNGVLSEHTTSVLPTKETEYGLLPTPLASLATHGGPNQRDSSGRPGLQAAAMMWPTPVCMDSLPPKSPEALMREATEARPGRSRPANLRDCVQPESMKMWPTPCATDHKGAGKTGQLRDRLDYAVERGGTKSNTYPTPTSSMMTTGDMEQAKFCGNDPKRPDYQTAQGVDGGQLNPDWVEVLMGWPKKWTCINPISHIQYEKWLMENNYAQKNSKIETMRTLRKNDESEGSPLRETGGCLYIQTKEILQSFLREYKERSGQVGVALEGKAVQEIELRMLWDWGKATGSPHRRELEKLGTVEFADFVHTLSQVYPSYGKAAWEDGTWEFTVPRVGSGIAHRVDRLKAIGNGQVPQVAALAWKLLMEDE